MPIATPDPLSLTPPSAAGPGLGGESSSPRAYPSAHHNRLYDASPRSPSQPPLAHYPPPLGVLHDVPDSPSALGAAAEHAQGSSTDDAQAAMQAAAQAQAAQQEQIDTLQAQVQSLQEQYASLQVCSVQHCHRAS